MQGLLLTHSNIFLPRVGLLARQLRSGGVLRQAGSCGTAAACRDARRASSTARAHAATVVDQEASSSASAEAVEADGKLDAPSFRAYIDFKAVRDNLQAVTNNCQTRNSSADPALVAQLYDQFVGLQQEADRLRAARNENSAAMKGKLEADERGRLVAAGKELKEALGEVEGRLEAVEAQLQREGQRLPNATHPDVPCGGEEAAGLVAEVGTQRDFDFDVKDHLHLGEALGLLDFETGAEVSGAKFYYLRGAGALLELALVNWTVAQLVAKGFTPFITPDLVRESVLEKCGFQPRANNTQVYSVRDSPLCLTGTAEVPLGGVCMDKILSEEALPLRMAAYGRCFRTEAGAPGAASRGLYRVHQFSKVEMFVVATPEQSEALLQELLDIEVELFSALGLHFKVLDMPSGDLGAPAYRKYDVEAWMPGLGRYGEISSASNCTDYQSRRLNIRYRPGAKADGTDSDGDGSPKKKKAKKMPTAFVHTLNATACAVPRMIVAILENFQQADGSVVVPEVLRPYMGGLAVIEAPPKR